MLSSIFLRGTSQELSAAGKMIQSGDTCQEAAALGPGVERLGQGSGREKAAVAQRDVSELASTESGLTEQAGVEVIHEMEHTAGNTENQEHWKRSC